MAPNQPLVIVLLGPTASGKTDLAIALAEALDLAVLNVDSRQLYRQMDVGTAKPTAAQRAQARHELLDLRDPDQPINLQEFRALAEAQLSAELARKPVDQHQRRSRPVAHLDIVDRAPRHIHHVPRPRDRRLGPARDHLRHQDKHQSQKRDADEKSEKQRHVPAQTATAALSSR